MSVYIIYIDNVEKIEWSRQSADGGRQKWMTLKLGGCEIVAFKAANVEGWPEVVEVPGQHDERQTLDELDPMT
jgi:hypothetical protein